MDDKAAELCIYRFQKATETLDAAQLCMTGKFFKDAINRSYYAAFYSIKAVLA
ncbi:HEPN domain-containing protein, partial [Muricomes intestini]|uniref:HEPN domain-containing protein n=1 Tax=Muricomes intestini TaxID=1796634 RepID=UPI002FE2FC04